jgi:histidinol dehydrogenase
VADILADVQARGDAAVLAYTQRFDGLAAASMAELELTQAELKAAFDALPPAQKSALEAAASRVRSYHEAQKAASGESWSYRDEDGTLLGQKVTPLDRVGIYVPGGKAAYPSSVLMNAIPAHVAGVGEIIMVVPTPRGRAQRAGAGGGLCGGRDPGLHHRGCAGGGRAGLRHRRRSQGRQDHRPRQRLCGQRQARVFGTVGIDMIAGPSEILVLADGSTPADWVAMDLFSQAEHDELAQSILLCPDAAYIDAVQAAIDRLLPAMPRREIIALAQRPRRADPDPQHGRGVRDQQPHAPEHLEVSSRDPHRWEPLLRHAGAIFLGAYTSESLGDYCAGPNHVLPTSGTARFSPRWGSTTSRNAAA